VVWVGCVVINGSINGCVAREGPLLVTDRDTADVSESGPQSPVRPGMRLQYQLVGAIDEDADAELFVIDLFETSKTQLFRLHSQDRVVVAYVSAGSYEPWRPDAQRFPDTALGQPLPDYPNECWVDFRDKTVRAVLLERLVLAADKGFDGVLLTSIDAYRVDNGFGFDAVEQLDFNLWLADQAKAQGLATGLSGDWNQGEKLAASYDFAIHMGCLETNRCDELLPYRKLKRPVFDLETSGSVQEVCAQAAAQQLPVTLKRYNWDAWFHACP